MIILLNFILITTQQCIQKIKPMNMPIVDKDLKTWNTYQFINSSEIISNHLYIRINRTNTYYDVFYNYTNL